MRRTEREEWSEKLERGPRESHDHVKRIGKSIKIQVCAKSIDFISRQSSIRDYLVLFDQWASHLNSELWIQLQLIEAAPSVPLAKHERAHLFEVENASSMWRGFGGATAASDTWVPCHTSCNRRKPSLPDFGFPTTKSFPPASAWPESRNFSHLGKFAIQNDRTLRLLQRVTCKALLLEKLSRI